MGTSISDVTQSAELTALRAEFDWIKEVAITPQQQALRDLQVAYKNFFAARALYPTPRRKGVDDAFRFQGREVEVKKINRNWSAVKLPKIGWVRYRDSRALEGKIKNVTLSRDALGWHVAFSLEIERDVEPAPKAAVGIDRGVANSVALSTGAMPVFPIEQINVLVRRRQAVQQSLAKRKKGSKRRRKEIRRAAAISARVARVRKHWNHVQTARIARDFNFVCIEDLRTANMTRSASGTLEDPGTNVAQKSGLNRSILERGWRQFETLLEYKLRERGSTLKKVDPKNTSRSCSHCEHVDARNRESQAQFRCVACGHEAHADVNAAINILRARTRPAIDKSRSRISPKRKSRLSVKVPVP
jgi:putative transposase